MKIGDQVRCVDDSYVGVVLGLHYDVEDVYPADGKILIVNEYGELDDYFASAFEVVK